LIYCFYYIFIFTFLLLTLSIGAAAVAIGNLISDLLYAALDPRIRL
jgi:ABC-type dipeptide/oligopeptide/nickel transport system permease component